MLENYWRAFVDVKVSEEYYFQYVHHSRHRVFAINALSCLIAFSGVVTWINEYLPPIWASVIILVAQVISALQPMYPFGDRLYASKCIYDQMRELALIAEQTFNKVQFGSMDESELPSALEYLQTSFAVVEKSIASSDLFPRNKRLHRNAEKAASQYLKAHFNLGGWTDG